MGLTLLDWSLAALGIFLIKRLLSPKPSVPLPPGPRPLPIVGNILNVPLEKSWVTFADWKTKYGDILSFHVLGTRLIIVNSAEMAVDILDKKSAIYSDRPSFTMAGELVGWKNTSIFLRYGETFREHRRNFHRLIGSRALMQKFDPVVEQFTRHFLQDILKNPQHDKLRSYIRKMAGSIILKISYGYDVQDENDLLVKLADRAVAQFSELVVFGTYLVDILPFLKYVPEWFPGAKFQKTAKSCRVTLNEMVETPYKFVKDQMVAGVAPPSFVSNLLEGSNLTAHEEHVIKWSAASLYSGGADTTVSAIYSFFLAMILYPEVQNKAQAEIDAVIGSNRLPTLADRAFLPYVEALAKEVVRWHVVAPLTFQHVAMEDGIHNGYLIPKGSCVLANIWGILHDKETYKEPHLFKPERFLGDHPELDPRTVSFGYGRRICPGIQLADSSVFISCAMSLAAFNITKWVENGVEITPSTEDLPGTILHPVPFKCTIKLRSPEAEALVLETPEY